MLNTVVIVHSDIAVVEAKASRLGLPPTTIILAEIDPLHDDGANLGDKMKTAGDTVTVEEFPGATRKFFGMGSVVANAKAAEAFAVSQLKAAIGD